MQLVILNGSKLQLVLLNVIAIGVLIDSKWE